MRNIKKLRNMKESLKLQSSIKQLKRQAGNDSGSDSNEADIYKGKNLKP